MEERLAAAETTCMLTSSPLRQELSHTNTYTMISDQWLHQFELAGFVAVEHDIFCHRYLEDGSAIPRPLDKDRFESYQRTGGY